MDRVFTIREDQSKDDVRIQLIKVSNKLGLENFKIVKVEGPFTAVHCRDIIYILKCQAQEVSVER